MGRRKKRCIRAERLAVWRGGRNDVSLFRVFHFPYPIQDSGLRLQISNRAYGCSCGGKRASFARDQDPVRIIRRPPEARTEIGLSRSYDCESPSSQNSHGTGFVLCKGRGFGLNLFADLKCKQQNGNERPRLHNSRPGMVLLPIDDRHFIATDDPRHILLEQPTVQPTCSNRITERYDRFRICLPFWLFTL